jgi:signal transduction histidine kinase
MNDAINATAEDGLRFFGRMSAAISHDLKNTLSIMNESAGLLEDLALLAEKGRPLDPQRIKQLGATIKRQIQRTDGIVRNMNRFAHSVDDPVKEIGLAASLEMLLAICRRLTDARGITVVIFPCSPDVCVETRPLYLYHMVWLLLEWCLDYAGPSKSMELRIEPVPGSVHLVFKGLAALTPDACKAASAQGRQDLLALLGAQVETNAGKQEIQIILPTRIRT